MAQTNINHETNISESAKSIFEIISKDKSQQREIDNLLATQHNILHGTFNELLVNPDKFDLYSEEEQGSFINAMYQITKIEEINPELFFNQKQIGKIRKYKRTNDVAVTLPYTFGNYVIQSSESDYITSLKFKEIGKLWNSKLLEYNTDVQRKPKEKVNRKGELVKTPKVIANSVKEITDLMLRKRFRSNTITFCIIMDANSDVSYEDGELTIVAGDMFIIDGFHRLSAILNVLEKDPDNDDSIDVSIKYLSFDDARYYLGQINKMSKFDKSFVNYLMNDRIQDKIVSELERKSALAGRIAKEATVAKKKTHLTSFNVLSNGIKEIFNPTDNKDRIEIAEVLTFFFDYLLDYYKEDFSKDLPTLIKARDKSLRNYHNTFVIYLVIAKKLMDKYRKNIPSDEIIRIVDSFDYSRDGEYAKVLYGEGSGKVNSNQVKKNIQKYAEEKVDQLLSQ